MKIIKPQITDSEYRQYELPSVTEICRRAAALSAFQYWNSEKVVDTASIRLGLLFDALVTKVDLDRFVVAESKSSRSKKFSEEKQILDAGKLLVTQEEWDKAQQMQASFVSHPIIKSILDRSQFQVACIDKENVIKGKCDLIYNNGLDDVIYDIKTTSDIERFPYTVRGMRYDMQLAAYMSLFGIRDGGWLVIETSPPYEVQIYRMLNKTYENALADFEIYHKVFLIERENEEKRNKRTTEVKYI